MKRFLLMILSLVAMNMMAQEKFAFVIQGSERTYNQVRVINRTSLQDICCRVVVLNGNDSILSTYGVYNMSGYDDADTNTNRITRGTKIGVQFPTDFKHELSYTVEYRDYPFFDAVVIILTDKQSVFSDEF